LHQIRDPQKIRIHDFSGVIQTSGPAGVEEFVAEFFVFHLQPTSDELSATPYIRENHEKLAF